MAMTPEEMVLFYGEQADLTKEGLAVAESTSNYYLGTLNLSENFKCRMMQGLITWRIGNDPSEFFGQAVQSYHDDWALLTTIGGETATFSDTPVEKVPFLSYLIGQQDSPLGVDGLEGDRLLDAVLGKWLFGSWEESLWAMGMEQLRTSGSKLALDTYGLYESVVRASSSDMAALMEKGAKLFSNRKSDKFYSGGDETESGGEDNNVTVDYRLASLAKRHGYRGAGTHVWKW